MATSQSLQTASGVVITFTDLQPGDTFRIYASGIVTLPAVGDSLQFTVDLSNAVNIQLVDFTRTTPVDDDLGANASWVMNGDLIVLFISFDSSQHELFRIRALVAAASRLRCV